jgi:hypothetical protein
VVFTLTPLRGVALGLSGLGCLRSGFLLVVPLAQRLEVGEVVVVAPFDVVHLVAADLAGDALAVSGLAAVRVAAKDAYAADGPVVG